jgi:ribose 5-phosphate isomerase B
MRIYLAADHAGFELKEKVRHWLKGLGYEIHDEGAFELEANDDYPDFIRMAAKQVASNPDEDKAIIFGGSGQGEAMVANRHKGVRAAVYYGGNPEIIVLSRQHNNANVLSIGARFVSETEAYDVIKQWLQTEFPPEPRHIRRIAKIDNLIKEENEF